MAKILIAVIGCEKYTDRAQACRDTWADTSLCDVMFFTGPVLGVGDTYEDLPAKTQAACRWALDHGYDWMFKADDDTYIWVERLLSSGFEEHHYSGFGGGKVPPPEEYASGGAGYWLDRSALEVVANALLTNDTCEDRWVGRVLYDAGMSLFINRRYAHGRFNEMNLITLHPCTPDVMRKLHA